MKRKIFSKLLMGAFLIASVSMFVSCKDYDDDISKNAADITALQAQLNSLQTNLTSELNSAKSDLATAKADLAAAKTDLANLTNTVNGKADASALNALTETVTNLTGRVATLETQIAAIADCATKAELAAASQASSDQIEAVKNDILATITAVTGDIEALKAQIPNNDDILAIVTANAASKSLETQVAALESFQKEVAAANYLTAADLKGVNDKIAELEAAIKAIDIPEPKDVDIEAIKAALQGDFQSLNDQITALADGLSAINMFVNKKLTSIVLKPAFYWEGIEGIETPYLRTPEFVEDGDYKFSYRVNGWTEGDNTIDVYVKNVMAWLATDGTKLQSETLKTWDPYYYNRKPANTSSTAYTFFSLIEQDGTALAAANKKNLSYVVIAPDAVAEYHVNPSSANLDGINYSFFENYAEVFTRADMPSIKATPKADKVTFKNGILSVPFSVDYPTVWNYFAKWAFDNNTYAYWQDNSNVWSLYNSGNEPTWDNAHTQNYSWVDYQNAVAVDTAGNVITVITDLWNNGYSNKPSAYGTSDYWDAKGNYTGQAVAPLPFISLTAAVADTTVNSDYAVVVPATYTIVALADNKPNVTLDRGTFVNEHKNIMNHIRDNHLYETVGVDGSYDYVGDTPNRYTLNSPGAIPSPATHDVAYRDTIDLLPFIETHYSYTTYTRYGQSTVDKVMTPDLMEKLGLHYEFKEIHYTIGKNATSESAHIQHIGDAKSGKFAPRSVTADGQTILDKEATREVIDREPLVRVDLVTEDGKIIRYGYIKLRITETQNSLDDVDVEVELGDYWMNCGGEARLTWSQVENLILSKLNDGKGMTKYEFERNYYFVNEAGFTNMPANYNGALYQTASDNKYYGARYYRNDKGQIVAAASATTEADAVNTFDYKKWTADNNWFGRVWYTPHDNATEAHAWDEQTNVIIWDLHGYNEEASAGVPYRGNMKDLYDVNLFKTLISVAGATYESKGLSTKAISTIVRFKNKNNDTYVNVKLTIPVGKLHFEYGAVDNKDWSHWFAFNSAEEGVKDDAKPYWKEFDAHVNPYKPSNNGYKFLDVYDYNQLLTDNWLDPTKMIEMLGDKSKFSKFYAPTAPVVSFIFTHPVKDLNSKEVSASTITLEGTKFANAWQVKGASGTVWTLQVGAHNGIDNTAIYAVGKGTKKYGPEEVVYLDDQLIKNGVSVAENNHIHYHGLETTGNLYPAATDLINLVGAYDAQGNPRFDLGAGLTNLKNAEYLDDNIDKTFTAYVKLEVAHDLCYDPLIGKNYFNVRIHRPINVVGKEYVWDDRVLNDNRLAIKELVEVVDWNRFPVVAYNSKKIVERNTIFGIEQPAFETVYENATTMKQQNAGIPFEYYGISELAVRYDEIRTDHAKQPSVRQNKYYDEAQIIANTDLAKDLNSLTSDRQTGLKTLSLINANETIVSFTTPHAYNHSDLNATGKGTQFGWIYYNNNASVVQEFHIYVPIAVKYNWGNIAWDTDLDAAGTKLDNDYTQTVWAIITVKGTH